MLSEHNNEQVAVLWFDQPESRWRREVYPNFDEAHARYVELSKSASAINVSTERCS